MTLQIPALRRRTMLIGALYGVIGLVFCAPLFARPEALGVQDWDAHLFYYGAVLKSVVEYGQLPFWNPWYCGGNVLWQNPQVSLVSPVYLLSAALSLPLAVKVNIVLHYWVGFVGMHLLLTRILGLSFLPAVVYFASVVTLAGAPVLHLAVGHNNFLPAFYLPLQLFWFLRALKNGSVRDVLLAGALLALMVFEGGVHIVPMAIAAIAACGVVVAIGRRQWRPLVLVVVFCAAGCAYAAPKLLPVTLYTGSARFFDARLPTEHPDRMTVEMLVHTYVDPYQNRGLKFDQQRAGWFEYGNYIGALAGFLIVASMLWIFVSRRVPDRSLGLALAFTTLLMLALSAGEFSGWAPASIAARLPLFSSFRIPSRYTLVVALFGTATAAWTLSKVSQEVTLGPRAKRLVAIVCLLASVDLLVRNHAQLLGSFPWPPFDTSFRFLDGPRTLQSDYESSPYQPGSPMFRSLMRDRSFYQCYEVLQVVHTADVSHPLVFSDEKSKVFTTDFTPNRVEFTVVSGNEPSRVLLNQNLADGWRSTAGAVVPDPASQKPSVMLAPGQAGKFAFRFVPPGLILGTVIFVVAVGLSVLVWNHDSARPTRSADP